MVEYRTRDGEPRRVHREYVDVVARFSRGGQVEPVAVQWRDGRSFFVDEILGREPFGGTERGKSSERYRVRFGGHETDLYLERTAAVPALGAPRSAALVGICVRLRAEKGGVMRAAFGVAPPSVGSARD